MGVSGFIDDSTRESELKRGGKGFPIGIEVSTGACNADRLLMDSFADAMIVEELSECQ